MASKNTWDYIEIINPTTIYTPNILDAVLDENEAGGQNGKHYNLNTYYERLWKANNNYVYRYYYGNENYDEKVLSVLGDKVIPNFSIITYCAGFANPKEMENYDYIHVYNIERFIKVGYENIYNIKRLYANVYVDGEIIDAHYFTTFSKQTILHDDEEPDKEIIMYKYYLYKFIHEYLQFLFYFREKDDIYFVYTAFHYCDGGYQYHKNIIIYKLCKKTYKLLLYQSFETDHEEEFDEYKIYNNENIFIINDKYILYKNKYLLRLRYVLFYNLAEQMPRYICYEKGNILTPVLSMLYLRLQKKIFLPVELYNYIHNEFLSFMIR